MRVLLLGHGGQVGTELVRGADLGEQLSLAAGLDLTDASALTQTLEREKPEVVLNAAAYTRVDQAEREPERAFAVNSQAPGALARWCAEHGAALLHISTDYVFDGTKVEPYREQDATAPLGVYGESKLAGELAVRSTLPRHVILRTSWVFSAHRQNFVKTMVRLGRDRAEVRVVADQHGRPTAAAEIARALWALVRRLREQQRLPWGTYHFAGAGPTTWYDFACAIFDEAAALGAKRPRVIPISSAEYPTPAKRPASSVLATDAFEQAFGFAPAPWRLGLREALRELAASGWQVG